MNNLYAKLPGALLPWYTQNKREMPWRRDREPYHVWLSEIMLQQTRVEAVRGYYTRFLAALPDIAALAAADPERLNKLWEGLGYYTRVRNLQKAAQAIVARHGGVFPTAHAQVLALPGIGEYTAGAVCSICFGYKTPAVDGNVLRVCSRVTESFASITDPKIKREMAAFLAEVYPAGQCGDFTQSLMELGATICGPNAAPQCAQCPCAAFCLAHAHGTAAQLPVKAAKKARRVADKTVFILRCAERFAVEKRPTRGLLAGLWAFPNVPGTLAAQAALDLASAWGVHPKELLKSVDKVHIFTHVQWNLRGYYLLCERESEDFSWVTREQMAQEVALPTAFRQFWEQ